jgi:hypothetical protein
MPEIRNPEQYQIAAVNIAARAKTDRTFYQSLLRDPVATLKREGLGSDAVRELLTEDAFSRTRMGGTQNDCTVSCICASDSGCCVTCWIASTGKRKIETLLDNPNLVQFGAADPALRVSPSRAQLVSRLVDRGHLFPTLKP